ncbi:MAG: Hsp20/alpha crystallin family protein [Terrimicrobiaceae bacterium]|nr:Hsp20/alpha crystallin family protein [Terrimicrobiaceae bacterium]
MSQIVETKPASPARAQFANFVVPAVNIHQDADGYTLEAEMPGVPKSGVEVTFEDGKLTLTGHRPGNGTAEGAVYRESSEADYRRAFDLDPSIDSSRIEAGIEQGLLTVRLPKAEGAKPRRIAVK